MMVAAADTALAVEARGFMQIRNEMPKQARREAVSLEKCSTARAPKMATVTKRQACFSKRWGDMNKGLFTESPSAYIAHCSLLRMREYLTQRHGGTKGRGMKNINHRGHGGRKNRGKYSFFLCTFVPWCEVLLRNEELSLMGCIYFLGGLKCETY
jgi:hypothetical protein